jgi:DNA polymerase delta subunit 2
MIVGILGKEISSGVFEAIDICLPGMPDQDPLVAREDDKYVAILSGLSVGNADNDMRIQLMSEFLTGELGSHQDEKSSSIISRVILAGNSVAKISSKVDSKAPVSNIGINRMVES